METINKNAGVIACAALGGAGLVYYNANNRMNGLDQEVKKINETSTKLQSMVEKSLVSKKEFEALKTYLGEAVQRLTVENAELRERLELLDREQAPPQRASYLAPAARREQEFHLSSYREKPSASSSTSRRQEEDSGLLELAPRSKERGR